MAVPKVAIVGRPNVGKSSIFNWLARKMVAVVDPTAGVTRDRVTYLMREGQRYFELVDTGGVGIVDSDRLSEDIERQIEYAIDEADLLLFVTDGIDGVLPLDEVVAERLREVNKPTILVVNKCESEKVAVAAPEFLRLMDAPLVVTSVKGNRGRKELLAAILENLPPADIDPDADRVAIEEPVLKLAVVGRRNVGKSTFINALAQAERVIASEVPGTTRDSIDVRFEMDGKVLLAIDTPGVRKRKSLANDIEFYGLVRAKRSIRRADVVLMFFDATQTISRVDKQLVAEIVEHYKPCVFVVNKWDLGLEMDMTTERWADYLERELPMLQNVPIAFITASSGRNAKQLVNLAQSLFKQSRERVGTGVLNRVVQEAVRRNPPPYRKNKRPKIYFATQVAVQPPTIVLKCNDPSLFDASWKRYLLHELYEALPFPEVPIKIYYRPKESGDRESADTLAASGRP
ncbi:MAG: ribosome biogenesis GTPase Der [Planctomycetota bacterium]|nr:MAG: ribosome biogenesis GTPase Der [Planctomycetota bacterium]